jgi:hypothetical protein
LLMEHSTSSSVFVMVLHDNWQMLEHQQWRKFWRLFQLFNWPLGLIPNPSLILNPRKSNRYWSDTGTANIWRPTKPGRKRLQSWIHIPSETVYKSASETKEGLFEVWTGWNWVPNNLADDDTVPTWRYMIQIKTIFKNTGTRISSYILMQARYQLHDSNYSLTWSGHSRWNENLWSWSRGGSTTH